MLESKNTKQSLFFRNLFSNHILIIALFILLTGLFTYPSFLEFDKVIGTNRNQDPEIYLNNIWWYNYNVKNPPEPFNFNWLFYNDRQFYPIGAPIGDSASFNMFISILIMPFTENIIHTYNIIMYLSFIFTGYGMFLLTKYLTKNYYASIVAGIIFTFGIYHMVHAEVHFNIVSLQFIPFSVLFFIKTIESKKIRDPIIGGIFLCLALVSSLYLGFFTFLFFIPLVLYYILTKRSFQTIIRIGIMFLIAASLAAPYYYGQYMANLGNESVESSLSEFSTWSTDLANFVLPTPYHSTTKIIDYPFETSFGTNEGWHFLGYTAVFLAFVAVLKTDKKEKTIWIISGAFLGIISLGPILKIYGIETGIQLPYYYLYELPFFDVFRTIGRAAILTTFSVAILAAYGINEIFKINSISNRKKLSIVAIIGILLIVESLTIPFSTFELTDSEIYHEIASDPREIVVLQAPIGKGRVPITDKYLSSDYIFAQTIFEKQTYAGFQARVSHDTSANVRTYFLNQFIADQSSKDIIQQDLKQVGISLFDYYDVGYVIVYTDVSRAFPNWKNPEVKKTWLPQTKSTLMEIFSKPPDFEDDRLYAYKIPEPSSDTPFIVLGDGWSMFKNDIRKIGEESDIKIINPTSEITEVALEIHFVSFGDNEISLLFNGKEVSNYSVDSGSSYRIIVPLEINPNENQLTLFVNPSLQLISEKTGAISSEDVVQTNRKIEVSEISFNNDSKQLMIEKLG